LRTYILFQADSTERKVVTWDKESLKTVSFKDLLNTGAGCSDFKDAESSIMSSIHSHSFVDVNMDCRPDIMLETTGDGKRYIEAFITFGEDTDKPFCYVGRSEVPDQTSHLTFADITGTGAMDALLLTNDLKMRIFINKQEISKTGTNLCSSNTDITGFPFLDFTTSKIANVTRITNKELL